LDSQKRFNLDLGFQSLSP